MQKPIIGLNSDFRPAAKERTPHSFIHAGYYDSVLAAGGIPVVLPPITKEVDMKRVVEQLDGVILTGGLDLDPKRMGLASHPAVRVMPPRREDSDRLLCKLAVDLHKPMLAISVGMQLLNVHCGGTLYLHLPEDLPRSLPHRDPLGGSHRHAVMIQPKTRLERIYGEGEIRVNSHHHQAVRKPAPGFTVSAKAPDGVVEAVEAEDREWFCLGLQWNPEAETASALDMQVFEALIAASSGKLELAGSRR